MVVRERAQRENLALRDSIVSPHEFYKLSSTYWGGFRDMLANECRRLLQRRSEEFEQYEDYATGLERDVSWAPQHQDAEDEGASGNDSGDGDCW